MKGRTISILKIINLFISIFILLIININPVYSARDTNSYDGNIFPIYAGNGSLVPPQSSLSESLKNNRTSVLVFYLDDNAPSKEFAPVVSGIKLLWSSSIDLIPIAIDEIDNLEKKTPNDPGFYWRGTIPQVVIIDGNGDVILDKEGQVSIEDINDAISFGTGLNKPDFDITVKSYNEYNSEPSKDGYNKPRGS